MSKTFDLLVAGPHSKCKLPLLLPHRAHTCHHLAPFVSTRAVKQKRVLGTVQGSPFHRPQWKSQSAVRLSFVFRNSNLQTAGGSLIMYIYCGIYGLNWHCIHFFQNTQVLRWCRWGKGTKWILKWSGDGGGGDSWVLCPTVTLLPPFSTFIGFLFFFLNHLFTSHHHQFGSPHCMWVRFILNCSSFFDRICCWVWLEYNCSLIGRSFFYFNVSISWLLTCNRRLNRI